MIGPLVPFNTMVHIVVSVLLHFCSGRELKFGLSWVRLPSDGVASWK